MFIRILLLNLQKQKKASLFIAFTVQPISKSFERMVRRLLRQGLPDTICSITLVAFQNRYAGQSIQFFAEQLLEKIKQNHHQRVIFLGHSRGGLVCAYLAEFLAATNQITVEAIKTFGTPFYGSYLAIAPLSWFSTSVEQMQTNNEFNTRLVERILISAVKYYFFVANDDYIVTADSSSIPDYVLNNPDSLIILKTTHGHLSMLSSHEAVKEVRAILFKVTKVVDPRESCSPSFQERQDCWRDDDEVEESIRTLFPENS
jgi:phage anti-repressor protein